MSFANVPLSLLKTPPQNVLSSALSGVTGGLGAMQKLRTQHILNQINQAKAAIAPQTAQAGLQKQLLANKIQQAIANLAPQSEQAKLSQAQAKPGLTKAQTLLAQAQARKALAESLIAGKGKTPDILGLYNAYNDAYNENPASAKTKVLSAGLQKAMQSQSGITQTTTPEGGSVLQIGGPAAAASPDAITAIHPGAALHPTHEAIVNQQARNAQQQQIQQLFPQKATSAQIADQKQLGKDLSIAGSGAANATNHLLPLTRKLRQAGKDLGALSGPVIGKLAWASAPGQRLQQLLALKGKDIMATVHNIRNQREFDMVMRSAGTPGMYSSVLKKTFNDALDEGYQNVLYQDFLKNYMAKGGNSSAEASGLWSKMLTHRGLGGVPKKYLDFKVSGTNRNYRDYIKTVRNLIAKNPKLSKLENMPIVSLIREDAEGAK